ncbi:uncharacterized protein [Haliotis asinina]|uniref:uncharacterized protein isoform X1 n=1 Tax=Haliotis asinina TaxID=109174 RepID=UPI003532661E
MADEEKAKKSATHRVKSLVSLFGLIFTVITFVCFMVGFSSPNWIEHFNKYTERQFVKMGLWEVCFKQWSYYKDYLGKKYNGCWWIFSFEYRPVWSWLNPPWLLAIQVLMVLTLMIMMVCLIFVIMYFVKCCPANKEKHYVMFSYILNFTAGAFIGISVIMFGIKADTDRQWLPHPDSNYLSWSFGFAVLSAFFALFAGMCLLVEWMRLNQEENNRARRQNMSLTSKPATRY